MTNIIQKLKMLFNIRIIEIRKIWNKITKFTEAIKYNQDIHIKIVSDFRTAHMNIIAWNDSFFMIYK